MFHQNLLAGLLESLADLVMQVAHREAELLQSMVRLFVIETNMS